MQNLFLFCKRTAFFSRKEAKASSNLLHCVACVLPCGRPSFLEKKQKHWSIDLFEFLEGVVGPSTQWSHIFCSFLKNRLEAHSRVAVSSLMRLCVFVGAVLESVAINEIHDSDKN